MEFLYVNNASDNSNELLINSINQDNWMLLVTGSNREDRQMSSL